MEFARSSVTVGGNAPATLALRTAPPAVLRGRITVDAPGAAAVALSKLSLTTTIDRNNAVPVAADGTFELHGVPGVTRVDLATPPAGWWLRSVMVGGVNAADDPIDLLSPANSRDDVQAVLARAARIAGTVVGATGNPPVRVIAVPVERDKRYGGSRYLRFATAGRDGRYSVDVPPGDYWVAALPSTEVLSEAALAQMEGLGTTVSASEAREARVDPGVVHVPR
jgi:hypothetical protein